MGSHSEYDLQEIHDFLVDLAKQAGEMIISASSLVKNVGNKKNAVDLVTETDKAVEEMISTAIGRRYPHYSFLGEETTSGTSLSDAPTFIIDPVDGTTNFVHRHSYVSISLGFAINRVASVGVVFNPFRNLLYSAVKGKGAYLNQTTKLPLQPATPLETLNTCLVAVEWGSDRGGKNMACKLATFGNLANSKEQGGAMVHGLRSMGSAALNLCAVASGDIDAYWEGGTYVWDVCAGLCILAETGGVVVDSNPGGWTCKLDGRRYFAIRGDTSAAGTKGMTKGQEGIVEEFWSHVAGDGFDYTAP